MTKDKDGTWTKDGPPKRTKKSTKTVHGPRKKSNQKEEKETISQIPTNPNQIRKRVLGNSYWEYPFISILYIDLVENDDLLTNLNKILVI